MSIEDDIATIRTAADGGDRHAERALQALTRGRQPRQQPRQPSPTGNAVAPRPGGATDHSPATPRKRGGTHPPTPNP